MECKSSKSGAGVQDNGADNHNHERPAPRSGSWLDLLCSRRNRLRRAAHGNPVKRQILPRQAQVSCFAGLLVLMSSLLPCGAGAEKVPPRVQRATDDLLWRRQAPEVVPVPMPGDVDFDPGRVPEGLIERIREALEGCEAGDTLEITALGDEGGWAPGGLRQLRERVPHRRKELDTKENRNQLVFEGGAWFPLVFQRSSIWWARLPQCLPFVCYGGGKLLTS